MGRTVPTWRGRVEQEIEVLVPYRRALTTNDRCHFDAMLHDVRMRRAAGGMLPAHEAWKPMLLSMILGAHERIQALEQQLTLLLTSSRNGSALRGIDGRQRSKTGLATATVAPSALTTGSTEIRTLGSI